MKKEQWLMKGDEPKRRTEDLDVWFVRYNYKWS